jgi:hypothetical protein
VLRYFTRQCELLAAQPAHSAANRRGQRQLRLAGLILPELAAAG